MTDLRDEDDFEREGAPLGANEIRTPKEDVLNLNGLVSRGPEAESRKFGVS